MKNKLIKILIALKIIFQSIIYRKKIYLFCVPYHGNIGDHAIAYAEEKIFEKYFSDYKLIEVETAIASKILFLIKPFANKSLICITGGGLLGNLWLNEERTVRKILKSFCYNKIILFPSTIFYTNDDSGKQELNVSLDLYNKCNNLSIFAREINTYNFLKANFKHNNIFLVPDIVLYLDKFHKDKFDDKILLCLRDDKEKVFDNKNNILKHLKKYGNIVETNTVNKNQMYYSKESRKNVVVNKIKEFGNSKLIFTDRLHGMIFAYLACTPCIAMDNKSRKVSAVFEWIKDCGYIKLYNEKTFVKDVELLLNYTYEKNELDKNLFKELIEKMKEEL